MSGLARRLLRSSDWQFVIGLMLVFVIMQLIGPQPLRYQADWVATTAPWRLLSAHTVHVGWVHLMINSLGLVVLVALIGPGWKLWQWVWQCGLLALGISLGFTFFRPELDWYVGFSGVLFGLYLLGAFTLCKRDQWVSTIIIAVISLKLITEQMGFDQLGSAALIGAPVVVDAHLYGSVIAIVIELLTVTILRPLKSQLNHE